MQWRKFASQKLMWSLRNVSNAEMHRNRRIRSLARDKIPPSILFNVRSAWSPIVNWRSFISVFLHQAVVLAWNRMSRRRKVRWNNFKFENLKKKIRKAPFPGNWWFQGRLWEICYCPGTMCRMPAKSDSIVIGERFAKKKFIFQKEINYRPCSQNLEFTHC